MSDDLLALAFRLSQAGEPFALATVVRCERPTSAKPGAKALIRKDGTLLGWIGGSCAEPVVAGEALKALRDGRSRFIALVGEGGAGPARREGVLEYPMTCHSGGTLEVYIEPVLPKTQLLLIGRGPVVDTLATLSQALDFAVTPVPPEGSAGYFTQHEVAARAFVVVATHGSSDEEALEHALRSEARYVSLVASRARADAVIRTLRDRGVPAGQLGRLKVPAGLDIGAVRPEEIAVSILAEIIQILRREPAAEEPRPVVSETREATDPVCGMVVQTAAARYRTVTAAGTVYFCSAHCKATYDEDPARYEAAGAR